MFNVRIVRQPGGSEMSFASGASLNILAGGVLSNAGTVIGNVERTAGSVVYGAGTLVTWQAGASQTIVTGVSGTPVRFDIGGGSVPSIGAGANVPTHTAPMGSIYLRANGSMSGLFTQIGFDSSGSVWRAFQQGSAIG